MKALYSSLKSFGKQTMCLKCPRGVQADVLCGEEKLNVYGKNTDCHLKVYTFFYSVGGFMPLM
jgi:hypothetical protein